MKPYKIHLSPSHGCWVDLDSIQAIHDVFCVKRHHDPKISENEGFVNMFPGAQFAVQFAFQDKTKSFDSYSREDESIDRLYAEHTALIQAWQNKDK